MLGFLKLFSDNSVELAFIINDGAYLVDVRTTGEFRSGTRREP